MDRNLLQEKLEKACRIAKACFDRSMGSGTSGNLSFMHEGYIFITAGGSCFGFLSPEDFSAVPCVPPEAMDPAIAAAFPKKPSKELPLHRLVYEQLTEEGIREGAVIHTHSTYAVLWSCVPGLDPADCVPAHTPYLRMKMGRCGLIPYEEPGSQALFDAFARGRGSAGGWLLSHHGLLTGGRDLMDAFAKSEELEESCKTAWMMRSAGLEKETIPS